MEKKKTEFYKKWWFWLIIVIFVIGIFGSSGSSNKNKESEQTSSQEQLQSTTDKVVFLKNSNGKNFYSILCDVSQISNKAPLETEDTYDYSNSNNNYSISMCTNKNNEICFISMMAYNQDYENFFLAASRLEYDGSNKAEIFNWIHDNLGKEATTKIGDANFKLYIGATKKPVLEIYTDGNDEFQQQLIDKLR